MRKKKKNSQSGKKHHRKRGIPEEYRKKPDRTGKNLITRRDTIEKRNRK